MPNITDLFNDINNLQKSFMCCEHIPIDKLKNVLSNISWEDQKKLVNLTVSHPLVKNYPITNKYQQIFLHNVISTIEEQNLEVHDDLYNEFCKLNTSNSNEKPYKHYILDKEFSKIIITLKESTSFVSEGTTGLCSWEASHALVDYLHKNDNLIRNKSVLELGAGVGLTGLFLWSLCEPIKYYLSDCHPSVLKLLCENVTLNCKQDRNCFFDFPNIKIHHDNSLIEVDTEFIKCFKNSKGYELSILNLDWENIEYLNYLKNIDIILAADVVYDPSIIPILCRCLKTLLNENSSLNCVAFVACTVRNADTILSFTKEIEDSNLRISKVVRFQSDASCTKCKTPVDIYKISHKNDNEV